MNEFEVQQKVILIKPHTCEGDLYTNEARVGDVGIVTGIESAYRSGDKKLIYVDWTKRADPEFFGLQSSAVDPECLGPVQVTIYEEVDA